MRRTSAGSAFSNSTPYQLASGSARVQRMHSRVKSTARATACSRLRPCIIGAGALVPQGMEIPDGSLAFGSPAKVRRALTEEEVRSNRAAAEFYCREAAEYAE